MKKDSFSTKLYRTSENASLYEAKGGVRARRLIQISEEYLEKILAEVRSKLTEGLSSAAEKLISNTLENYSHTPNNQAKLSQLLSYTFETRGTI